MSRVPVDFSDDVTLAVAEALNVPTTLLTPGMTYAEYRAEVARSSAAYRANPNHWNRRHNAERNHRLRTYTRGHGYRQFMALAEGRTVIFHPSGRYSVGSKRRKHHED